MPELTIKDLQTLLQTYTEIIQGLRIEVDSLRRYVFLLESVLRGMPEQAIEDRQEFIRLH